MQKDKESFKFFKFLLNSEEGLPLQKRAIEEGGILITKGFRTILKILLKVFRGNFNVEESVELLRIVNLFK